MVEAAAEGGPELAVKTDAMGVRTSSEATGGSAGGNLAAAEADVTRLRLGLEGTWRGLEIGTDTLVPRLEIGVPPARHSGPAGLGSDAGLGPRSEPDPEPDPGSLGARWGGRAAGPYHAGGAGGDELDRRRLEVKLGYGFGAFGDRFTSTPEAGFGMSEGHRDYSLVWRFVRDRRRGDIGSLEFSLEARRRESANDPGSGSGQAQSPSTGSGSVAD